MKFYVKVHEQGVVAVADAELLGKRFEDGGFQLDVSQQFYGGEMVDEESLLSFLEAAKSLNIVGERAVAFAVQLELVSLDAVISVGGVPHVQVYSL